MTHHPIQRLVSLVVLTATALFAAACSTVDTETTLAESTDELTFAETTLISMEAEHFTTNTSQGGKSWTSSTASSPSGGQALIATPDSGAAVNTGYTTTSPRLSFDVTFAQSGTYQVWIRGRAGGSVAADSDSCHVGLDGAAVASADRITGFTASFGWSRATMDNVNATLSVPSAGLHTVNVWMSEDGFVIDKIVLTRDSAFTPTGTGPAETPTTTCTNGGTRPGTTPCGINNRGVIQQTCSGGTWTNNGTCLDPDVCLDGQTRAGTAACGLNGRGTFNQQCTSGQWVNTTCADTDVCVDGATRLGPTACGAGGHLVQTCTVGQWVDGSVCSACGNAVCERTENCNSCAADCGACPAQVYLEASGQVSIEAEHYTTTSANGSTDTWTLMSNASASNGQEMQVGADNGTMWTANIPTTAPRLTFDAYFATTGTWNLWVKGRSAATNQTSGDSCWGGVDNAPNASYFDFADNGATGWFSKSVTIGTRGVHTVTVWGREDGFYADKLVLAKNTGFTPTGNGPAESSKGLPGTCGDGTCNPQEDCGSCSSDCGICTTCGNATCEAGETCSNCATDCGACPLPGMDTWPSNPTCVAPAPLASSFATTNKWPNITFTSPIQVVQPLGDSSRLIVVQRGGLARSVPINATSSSQVTNFLQLSNVVTTSNGGFLSMAFHPNWATNRFAYVVYTTSNLMKRLSRFTSTDGGATLNASTEQVVLQIQHLKEFNHNGGQIAFGNDGYLYMSSGDDAYLDYTRARQAAQTNNLFGKILRIDVNGGSPYSIPPTNPFASGGGSPEVYAYGFRNPWRFSFDKTTGELWEADVGEDTWEEMNKVTPGFYGWPYYEGTSCFSGNQTDCSTPYTAPTGKYGGDSSSRSISGGFVYRGSALPSLYGKYVFGDYVTGQISYFDPSTGIKTDIGGTASGGAVVGFGQDNTGELYVVRYSTGKIEQLVAGNGGGATDFPSTLGATGCFSGSNPTQVVSGVVPYTIAQSFWSDGAAKERFIALPNGTQITVDSSGDWVLPPGGVTIKNFRLDGQLFETRFFVRHSDGTYSGYTYQWNDAQTQANLVPPGGATRSIAGLNWSYPTRAQCFACHSASAQYSLGIETRQLNIDETYPSTGRTANQHFTFNALGKLTGNTAALTAFPAINDESVALETRAMAYLHINCSSCHRPGGIGAGTMDARFDTSFANKGICNANPGLGDLGVPGAKLIKPGDHMGSVVWLRMSQRGSTVGMPPLASTIVDANGAAMLQSFIDGLTGCPAP
jgi:uncharacterized repeat protein (TIGR03806 family)